MARTNDTLTVKIEFLQGENSRLIEEIKDGLDGLGKRLGTVKPLEQPLTEQPLIVQQSLEDYIIIPEDNDK